MIEKSIIKSIFQRTLKFLSFRYPNKVFRLVLVIFKFKYGRESLYLLENNLDKINWSNLSLNQNAIHILEKNLDKIDWSYLSSNTSIFEPDNIEYKN